MTGSIASVPLSFLFRFLDTAVEVQQCIAKTMEIAYEARRNVAAYYNVILEKVKF